MNSPTPLEGGDRCRFVPHVVHISSEPTESEAFQQSPSPSHRGLPDDVSGVLWRARSGRNRLSPCLSVKVPGMLSLLPFLSSGLIPAHTVAQFGRQHADLSTSPRSGLFYVFVEPPNLAPASLSVKRHRNSGRVANSTVPLPGVSPK